jgi:uncharacterized membrane protein
VNKAVVIMGAVVLVAGAILTLVTKSVPTVTYQSAGTCLGPEYSNYPLGLCYETVSPYLTDGLIVALIGVVSLVIGVAIPSRVSPVNRENGVGTS